MANKSTPSKPDKKRIVQKYQKLGEIEHVLKRPEMYIGAIEPTENQVWIWDSTTQRILQKTITYSPGLYKIFDEVLVNAYDQTVRDPTVSVIKVEFNEKKNEISVYNNGVGIDVVIHPKEKIYVPELIFGHLRSSTSFDDSASSPQITGGIHGLGAKLTAILSTSFKVEVADSVNHKHFVQTYKSNLKVKSSPVVTPYTSPTGWVKITFQPDLAYFGLKTISPDQWHYFTRRVYDMGGLVRKGVKVYLNGQPVPVVNMESYINLFTSQPLVHVKERCHDRWFIGISLNLSHSIPNHMSWVNGINTLHGGKHVDYIMGQILKGLKAHIQSRHKQNVSSRFISDHIFLFVSAVIEKPAFSSQTKDELVTPINKFGSTCEVTDSFIKKVYTSLDFETLVKRHLQALQSMELSKTDTKKKKTIKGITKLYDANWAGTAKSDQCTLILTEGDSAKTMAVSGLSAIQGGNNIFGVFPLKGKLLNVRDATHSQIVNNEEFAHLKQIMGLTNGKVYNSANLHELRYGHIMLMMDADVDGSHIKGLFINMIHFFWPSLLEIEGFLKMFITPVVKVTQGKTVQSFYNLTDYTQWRNQTTDMAKWTIKYYKGLGTNTAVEAKEYFSNLKTHTINFKWDESTAQSIELGFAKDKADDRKKWLKKYDRDSTLNYKIKTVGYTQFIHKELIHFSNSDNVRSVPSVIDGLKPSQRKVLYGALKRPLTEEMKVSRFVGWVSEVSAYHHGEASLSNTIIGMAQNFVGSNNLNWLEPKGQFGTRLMGGKDHASARYIFTQLAPVTRHLFNKHDDPILHYLDDDGFPIEPEYYVPILPTVLINGAEGIGTGYSTFVPKYSVAELVDAYLGRIKGTAFTELQPNYQGFKGTMIRLNKSTYLTKGVYKREGNMVRVVELPLTLWTETYKSILDDLVEAKPFISSVVNHSTETHVHFDIKFNDGNMLNQLEKGAKGKPMNDLEKLLLLGKVINLTNMHLFNKDGVLTLYTSIRQIMEEFYHVRLNWYDRRKKWMLEQLEHEIAILESKIKFIDMVVKDQSKKILGQERSHMIQLFQKNKLYVIKDEPLYDYILRMPVSSMTKEKITELLNQLHSKQTQYSILQKTSPEQLWTSDLEALKKVITTS